MYKFQVDYVWDEHLTFNCLRLNLCPLLRKLSYDISQPIRIFSETHIIRTLKVWKKKKLFNLMYLSSMYSCFMLWQFGCWWRYLFNMFTVIPWHLQYVWNVIGCIQYKHKYRNGLKHKSYIDQPCGALHILIANGGGGVRKNLKQTKINLFLGNLVISTIKTSILLYNNHNL